VGIRDKAKAAELEEAKMWAFYNGLSPKPHAALKATRKYHDTYKWNCYLFYANGYSDGVAMKQEMEKARPFITMKDVAGRHDMWGRSKEDAR
jgi:hypothetical protein